MSQPWEYSCLGVVYNFPTITPRNFSSWSMFLICKVQIYRNLLMDSSSNYFSTLLMHYACFSQLTKDTIVCGSNLKICSLVEHQDDLMVQVIWFYANFWTCGQFDQESIQSMRLVKAVHLFHVIFYSMNLTTSSCWHKKFGL